MASRLLLTSALGLILTACAVQPSAVAPEPTGTSAAETEASAPEFVLDYEKFTLDNGLEVILHVDTSDPVVAVTTVIHAGSNRERPGRTGFAHFFEHMAFNDSENVPRGWNRKAIPDWGGDRNGGTWSDGTIYYEAVPKDAFDKILWIDSDRLGYMINTVTNDALEREKQVVKNEKRQRVDNAPYGYTQEVIRTALYPEGHPYSWTVIGSLPDLQAATLEDLREFYDEYYGAANATLVIAGDIDPEETRHKVELWFGEIRSGPDIEPLPPMPVELATTRKLYFEDNFATLPELRLTFPTIEAGHPDEAALTVLANLLAGSKTSPLHETIVETERLAPSVFGFSNSMELAGEMVLGIRANADTDLDAVYAALNAALETFESEGVDPNDLQRIKAEQETQLYGQLSTVLGKSNQMAQDNEFFSDPTHALTTASRVAAVTAEDVMAAYDRYVRGKPAIITSFVPKGSAELALEDSELATVWIEEVVEGVSAEEVSQGEEADYERTPSVHDRSEPPFGELPLFEMPDIWETSLANDARLVGIETSEIPLVTYDVTIASGSWLDPDGKAGTASLLARVLNEGTASRLAGELEQAIGLLGARITASSSVDDITINVAAPARNFEKTVALVTEMLAEPRWNETDFERVKSAALTSIRGREANPTAVANLAFSRLIYGDDHPLGIAPDGSEETVSNITLDDLKAFYEDLQGAQVRFHVVGDVTPDRARAALEPIASRFDGPALDRPSFEIPPQDDAGKVYFIDVPGSKQSVLFIGKLTIGSLHPDATGLQFANEKIGGGISGDFAQVLRIEKGYTYGAVSFVSEGEEPQPYRAITSVRANATGASLDIMRDMLSSYGEDYSAEDAETVRLKLVKQASRANEGLDDKLGILRTLTHFDRSLTYLEDEQQELLGMSVPDYQRLIGTYLDESEMTYLVVGDAETQLAAVEEFAGGPVTQLDIRGNPLP